MVSRKLAEGITGGLPKPGKMPCPGWGMLAALDQLGHPVPR